MGFKKSENKMKSLLGDFSWAGFKEKSWGHEARGELDPELFGKHKHYQLCNCPAFHLL